MTPAAVAPQIAMLLERVDTILSTLKDLVTRFNTSEQSRAAFREEYIVEHSKVVSKTDSAHTRIDKLEIDLSDLAECVKKQGDDMRPVMASYRIIAWIGAVFGVSVIGLIWSIITGQVKLVFP